MTQRNIQQISLGTVGWCWMLFLWSGVMGYSAEADRSRKIQDLEDLQLLTDLMFLKHGAARNSSTPLDFGSLADELKALLRDFEMGNFSGESVSSKNCTLYPELGFADSDPFCHASFDCPTVDQLVALLPNTTYNLREAISRLCPILLFKLQDKNCHINSGQEGKTKMRPKMAAVWGFGILFVTLISSCSLVGVVILPALNKNIYKTLLMVFEGLAVGSLAGSAVFHLIPQAFNLLGQDREHGYLWKALLIFCGIYLFFITEHLMKIFMSSRKRKRVAQHETGNGTLYSKCGSTAVDSSISVVTVGIKSLDSIVSNGCYRDVPSGDELVPDYNMSMAEESKLQATNFGKNEPSPSQYHGHEHQMTFQQGRDSVIGTVAWMIIFGDGLHNFIDGLSIGAAFTESILAGVSISMAVVCEEFPHELGDFAVLLSAGMSMKQALMYNFLSACTCYAGLIVGILLGDLAEGSHYIFALAGGMFLYISLVDMMGELNEALEEASRDGIKRTLKVFFFQNLGIIIGVAALFLLARYSERINFEAFGEIAGNNTAASPSSVSASRLDSIYKTAKL